VPREPNGRDRFTVAVPAAIRTLRTVVAAGMTVMIFGLAAASAASGPLTSSRIAAVALPTVVGTTRRTGTSLASPPARSRNRK
jgi:hypothetical protein